LTSEIALNPDEIAGQAHNDGKVEPAMTVMSSLTQSKIYYQRHPELDSGSLEVLTSEIALNPDEIAG